MTNLDDGKDGGVGTRFTVPSKTNEQRNKIIGNDGSQDIGHTGNEG